MICTFDGFDGSILAHSASVAYKYVIHSPKSASNPYEFLHGHGMTDFNRCLIFPDNGIEKYYRGIKLMQYMHDANLTTNYIMIILQIFVCMMS